MSGKKKTVGKKNKSKVIHKGPNGWMLISILALITFFSFRPMLHHDFLNWDDETYIHENPLVQNVTFENVKEMFNPNHFLVGNYHPLTELSFALNYAFSELEPNGYLWTNLILHLLNVLVLFWLVYWLFKKNTIVAFITAGFFAIHPMHVESVAWIAERKDLLYTFFYLLGLLAYIKYFLQAKNLYLILTLLCFFASLLSKGQAVTFPLIIALMHFLFNRWTRKDLAIIGAMMFASLAFGILAFKAQGDALTMVDLSLLDRLLVGSQGFALYLIKLFVPFHLSALHPYPMNMDWPVWVYATPISLLLFLGLIYWSFSNNRKKYVFGLAFFLVTIFPVLQFTPVGLSTYAERYTYIPYIGLSLIHI